ncbi:hypothetical protein D5086_014425 [Populus alba]|uniref:Uncharacterized protein n=1 Tax=Populus alba TaxID=43335 RepID=A0ACC4BXG4_POPAL
MIVGIPEMEQNQNINEIVIQYDVRCPNERDWGEMKMDADVLVSFGFYSLDAAVSYWCHFLLLLVQVMIAAAFSSFGFENSAAGLIYMAASSISACVLAASFVVGLPCAQRCSLLNPCSSFYGCCCLLWIMPHFCLLMLIGLILTPAILVWFLP